MGNILNYCVQIEREFGSGVKPRGFEKFENEVKAKHKKALVLSERHPTSVEAQKAREAYESAQKALETGEVFGADTPDETIGLLKCDSEINLADIYDVRFETNEKTARLVVENYGDTSTSDVVAEGEEIGSTDIREHISTIKTDRESIMKIAKILNVPETMLEDEKDLLNGSIDHVQSKMTENMETMILCKLIATSKEGIEIQPFYLFNEVNKKLCANAKLRAEIITNDSGFSKLDINDLDGNPLMKKDFTIGEFVFADRFIVRTVSDDILENNEDGSAPVFVGDWKNVLRLVVVKKYPPLVKTNVLACKVENRAIEKVIPLLTTTSDKAFIVGYMK